MSSKFQRRLVGGNCVPCNHAQCRRCLRRICRPCQQLSERTLASAGSHPVKVTAFWEPRHLHKLDPTKYPTSQLWDRRPREGKVVGSHPAAAGETQKKTGGEANWTWLVKPLKGYLNPSKAGLRANAPDSRCKKKYVVYLTMEASFLSFFRD